MMMKVIVCCHVLVVLLGGPSLVVHAFAASSSRSGGGAGRNGSGGDDDDATTASFTLFDRFQPTCPANPDSIRQFDTSLITDNEKNSSSNEKNEEIWVAVYRSGNNKPSVLVRDEFLMAMRSATDSVNPPSSASSNNPAIITGSFSGGSGGIGSSSAPVAVARLRSADESNNDNDNDSYILDSMRCILKKENTDTSCDGGSEHTEAISTAIDTLLRYYLHSIMPEKEYACFEGVIRTKATLISGALLEDRGFRPVEKLQKDMTTHISSLDDCLERFAARSVSTDSRSPGARQRAIDIVSGLGRIDRDEDFKRARELMEKDDSNGNDDDEYDPWAGVKQFI